MHNISLTEKDTLKTAIWLVSLLLFSLLLSLIFYIILLYYSSEKNELSSKIYEQSLVASINQYEYLPSLLSTDTVLVYTLINKTVHSSEADKKLEFAAKRAGAEVVYLMNLAGTVVASSNHASKNSFVHRNYSFRPYFTRAIIERKRQFYYAKGATTGIPGFFISAPVVYLNRVIGVVVVKLDMSYWEKNWSDSKENVIATDENNVIILTSEEKWRYRSIGTIPQETISEIKLQQQFTGNEHLNIYKESFTLSLFKNLDITFWLINNTGYIIHQFSIPEVNWSLYHLVPHRVFLLPSIGFFLAILAISVSIYFMRRERKYKLASIYKTQQLELARQEDLKAVIDNVHVGVMLFSPRGELISINNHSRHLLFDGKIPNLGKTIYIQDIIDIDSENLNKLLLTDITSQTYHETHALKNGEKTTPVMFALSKLAIMEENLYLMTFINITRRKDAEKELRRINNSLEDTIEMRTNELRNTQAKLMQKNKATALGNMAATIVHELTQPLSAMNSSIAAIDAKINNNDLDGAVESANRLTPLSKKMYNVIKLLKYFSYQDPESDNTINLTQTIEESLDAFKDVFIEKGIIFNYTSEDTPINIKINPLKLDLALSNIVNNAIDASENNETPRIEINITLENEKDALITITDNGGGIDENIIQNMFNPYFTTKEVGKGLGLGLSITYEIIQEYYGNITVSNTDEGACFTISLPLANDSATVYEKKANA